MDFDRKTLATHQATAERYHANLDDATIGYLAGRGITGATVDEFLLGTCDDLYPGWLSIPYLRPHGVVSFKFRRLTGEGTKYKNLTGAGTHLYNTTDLDIADQTGTIAIAEGEIDALTASALCGVPCVGVPGATQWTGHPHWHELFRGYQQVHILADPDQAGNDLAMAICATLPQARLIVMPGDVNETYLAYGGIKEFLK